jgi:YesN/AraC family two-component response regulator
MPRIKGVDVAKEILAVYPRQRILLVSAYVTILEDSARQYLKHHVEVLQKPVSKQILIDTIEDKAIYSELEKLGIDTNQNYKTNMARIISIEGRFRQSI